MKQLNFVPIVIIVVLVIAAVAALAVVISILVARCTVTDKPGMEGKSYTRVSQEEARRMMAEDDGHVVVDVRRQDEFDGGHIPGAICIPNESIESERPRELPDPDQIILIYCRSGRRSKEAAQKLFDMGYNRVYEFGGILEWTGDVTPPAHS